MTGISGEKLILQQVKAFLATSRKHSSLGIIPFRWRSHAARDSTDRSILCINFLRASIFFATRFYFVIDIAYDPSLSSISKSATIAQKIMRADSFALFSSSMRNSVNYEKFLLSKSVTWKPFVEKFFKSSFRNNTLFIVKLTCFICFIY